MRKLSTLALVAPGAALAHGGHAPVPEMAHGLAHAALPFGLVMAALLVVGLIWRARS
ncbi:MAG: hypothetical protein QNJ03_01575 [Dinoroseobacter sp.]|nr:hypothetical protein [Dinoroseobacter sp.]